MMQKLLVEISVPDTLRESERIDLVLHLAELVETFLNYRDLGTTVSIDRDELDHHKPWLIEGKVR